MRIAVLGTGYVGCVTAAILAREGHRVTGIDSNPEKVALLARGATPVLEPGLEELVRRGHSTRRLTATTDLRVGVAHADVVMICVGTPSAPNGALDGSHVERVAREVGGVLAERDGYPVVALRSTVLPETIERVILPALQAASGKRVGRDVGFAVNPEFLREGSAIEDFDHPPFTLVGTGEHRSAAILRRLYAFVKAPVVVTDRGTASLAKYASNAFHATKVALANEIGALSKAAGVDGQEVMRIVALDRKLNASAAYLRPGMPFGGSCLPKDVRGLVHYARRQDLPVPLLGAVLESNRLHVDACTQLILAHGRARIGILGMAFKAGTDDLRESPIVAIAETLLGKGARLAIYDSRVSLARLVGTNRDYVEQHLPHIASLLRPSLADVVASSEVLVIGNADEEFRTVSEVMRPEQVLIDLVGLVTERSVLRARYHGIGW